MDIASIIAEAQARAKAEEEKFNAMTPEQQGVYMEQQKKDREEAETLLAQLRGKPGFFELKF